MNPAALLLALSAGVSVALLALAPGCSAPVAVRGRSVPAEADRAVRRA